MGFAEKKRDRKYGHAQAEESMKERL